MSDRGRGQLADLAAAFRGVTVTIVTPFAPDTLDLDLTGLVGNLRFVARRGVSVVVPAGNTGEFTSLTGAEIRTLAECTVAEVGGRAAVVVGVGGDVRGAVALAEAAQQAGAVGVMVHEPAHPFVSDDGLVAYYGAICRAVDLGVAIYKRTPRLGDRVLLRVAREHANVVAIKYAHNDVASFLALAAALPAQVTAACGSAERWALPFAAAGRVGYTSGIANFAPELTLQFWRLLEADRAEARSLWQRIVPFEDVRAADGAAFNVAVVKHAMDLVGLAGGPLRPPLSSLSDEVEAVVTETVRGWQRELGLAVSTPLGAEIGAR